MSWGILSCNNVDSEFEYILFLVFTNFILSYIFFMNQVEHSTVGSSVQVLEVI